jgi:hypothetical protein
VNSGRANLRILSVTYWQLKGYHGRVMIMPHLEEQLSYRVTLGAQASLPAMNARRSSSVLFVLIRVDSWFQLLNLLIFLAALLIFLQSQYP